MFRLIPVILAFSSIAYGGFYDRSMEGFYWYDDPKLDEEEMSPDDISEENALVYLLEMKQKFESAKALAVLKPNRDNLLKYLTMQNALVENAEKFSQVWQQLLLEVPSLNGEIEHPTAQYAIESRKAHKYLEIEGALKKARENHVLMFVYDSTKNYSQIAGSMIEAFQADTGWTIVPITVDGKDLPGFPGSKVLADQGLALGLQDTPAYIIGNIQNEMIKHVGFGAIAISKLKENIYKQLKADP